MLSLFVFILLITVFYRVLNNISPQGDIDYASLKRQAMSIAEGLSTQGTPQNWTFQKVTRVGLMNSDGSRASPFKLFEAKRLSYNELKRLLGVGNEFIVVFTNATGSVINIGGYCSLGYDYGLAASNSIGYYTKSQGLSYIVSNITALGGDLYNLSSVDDFFSNISNYQLLVIENPHFDDTGGLTLQQKLARLEEVVANGTHLVMSGVIGGDLLNVSFLSESGGWGLATQENEMFRFVQNQNVSMYYSTTLNSTNSSILSLVENTANHSLVAEWSYGNGSVVYLSNFSINDSVTGRKLWARVMDAIRYNIIGNCSDLEPNSIQSEHLAKIERYLIMGSRVMRMEVYAWV
ncbi:hypothetical protein KY318_00050 [Candidatus Woesearchaeota archaeon]|nr:hypothetical protein [Candidatus Woesearchaeota archaeon]